MKNHSVTCDACGRTKSVDEDTDEPWLVLQTMATETEQADIIMQLRDGAKIRDLVPGGDFCSLMCVANWSNARHLMGTLHG
jgi:hypothetical protein